jgi:hypothetical protein
MALRCFQEPLGLLWSVRLDFSRFGRKVLERRHVPRREVKLASLV